MSDFSDSELEYLRKRLLTALDERDRLFPVRDSGNTASMNRAMEAYFQGLVDSPAVVSYPDEKLSADADRLIEEGVFICGWMKSGTTLLVELLDGHDQLLVMPGDSNMVNLLAGRTKIGIRSPWIEQKYQTNKLEGWSLYWASRFINPKGQKPFFILGENDDNYRLLMAYIKHFHERQSPKTENLFEATIKAYYCANPRRPARPKHWVEKTPGNERNVRYLLNRYPRARFIHVLRDPFANMRSLKKRAAHRGIIWSPFSVARALRRSFRIASEYAGEFGREKYFVVRYEDLVTGTKRTMGLIAEFLEIEESKTLLAPTVNGLPATSNSMFSERRTVGKVFTGETTSSRYGLSQTDETVVRTMTKKPASEFGYQVSAPSIKAYFALRSELWTLLKRKTLRQMP